MAEVAESPRLSGGYEIVNALGRLNADRPKLGARCTDNVALAKVLRLFLHALDLHQQQTGKTVAQINRDIRAGKIEMRFMGPRVVLVMH